MNLSLHPVRLALIVICTGSAGWLFANSYWWLGALAVIFIAALLLTADFTPATAAPSAAPTDSTVMANPGFQILEGVSDPALLLDANMRLKQSNKAAQKLFGNMVVGEAADLYLRHPLARSAIRDSVDKRMTVEQEVTLFAPTERSYTVACTPVPGTEDLFLVLLHDVTRLKLADRMRADFVANASHELRTPLATLIGFIETLQGPASMEADIRERFLSIMSRESGRMARLVDDLLSLSKIEMDKHVAPSTPLDIRPLLKEVGSTLAMRLDADSRFIKLSLPDDLPQVFADRDQILQVLHNLMSNALKYGRSGSPIDVAAIADTDFVTLSISDQGEGIPPEHLPRLTERFYRIDTARSRDMGGTGLGLAIVKHIVERHRGTLQIRSQLGQGTTVTVSFPRSN
jgi:two-component system, OmpR family, phosphate regulon sensor histidine kinase PhoR